MIYKIHILFILFFIYNKVFLLIIKCNNINFYLWANYIQKKLFYTIKKFTVLRVKVHFF